MLQRHTPCRYIIILHYTFLQRYMEVGYSPLYVIVVTWARVLCLIYMPQARGPQARGLRAYISGKARVPMLQLICYTSGTPKSAQNLTSIFPSVYIVTIAITIVGVDFNVSVTSCIVKVLIVGFVYCFL